MKSAFLKSFIFLTTIFLSGGNAMANSQQQNSELISAFSEKVFINKDLSELEKYMHEDYIQHNPFVEQGISGFKTFFNDWFTAIPDFNYNLKQIIINDDYVWVYGTYSGTHSNTWLGIEPTNAEYKFDGVDIFRIADGKLAEHWDVLDLYGLFKQLGTIQ